MVDLTELQRLAEGATPGLWRCSYDGHGGIRFESITYQIGHLSRAGGKQEANAAYIAAMHPDTAKKLIAVAVAAQKALAALEEAQTYTASPSWSPSMTLECKDAEVGLRTALEELK